MAFRSPSLLSGRRRDSRLISRHARRPGTAAEAMRPRDFGVVGPFCLVQQGQRGRKGMASEEKHYVSNGTDMATAPAEALEFGRSTQAKMVDLKFTDLLGSWQHMSLPLSAFDESAFDEGLGFDGSSIRGWQGIQESDMLLVPQADTAILDPFTETPTLSILCEVIDPITREAYPKDPRRVARAAEEYLRSTGVADTSHFGPESEFFVFDSVAYDMKVNGAH